MKSFKKCSTKYFIATLKASIALLVRPHPRRALHHPRFRATRPITCPKVSRIIIKTKIHISKDFVLGRVGRQVSIIAVRVVEERIQRRAEGSRSYKYMFFKNLFIFEFRYRCKLEEWIVPIKNCIFVKRLFFIRF